MDVPPFAERLAASSWVAASPGLAEAAADWHRQLAAARTDLAERAAGVAQPGLVPPARVVQHAVALQRAQLRWATRELPLDLADDLRPVRDPTGWLAGTVARIVREQLAMLGASGAELARVVLETEGLAPVAVSAELRRDPPTVGPEVPAVVRHAVGRELGTAVDQVDDAPLVHAPLSQLHRVWLAGAREAMVRVRRPGVERDLQADARIIASLAALAEALVPGAGSMHLRGLVELATRQFLEETDLRNEALNAVELALAVEELAIPGVVVARPIPGLVGRGAVAYEHLDGRPLATAPRPVDPERTVAAIVGVSFGAAFSRGVFHAGLRPENFLALDGETLGVVGMGTVGRFDLEARRAVIGYLLSLLGGDVDGQIDALRRAGAVPEGADVDGFVAATRESEALQPMAILGGGEAGLLEALRTAIALVLRHGLRPPLEMMLFVRSVFGLRSLLQQVAPEVGLMNALLPVVQDLPQLREKLDAVAGEAPVET